MPNNNCKEEKEKYAEARERVRDLSERFNDLLLRLDTLIEKHKRLIKNAQKSLGAQVVAYIVTLPFDRVGVMGELLQRHFGNIISDRLLQTANSFMRQVGAVKQETQYVRDQRDMVFAQLERAAKELENAKKRLAKCKKNKEER